MRRRDFITLLGGAAASWPLAARAQQTGRLRRVGALWGSGNATNPGDKRRVGLFEKGLQELGWVVGQNIEFHYRWGKGDTELSHQYAKELIGMQLDLIMTSTNTGMAALHRAASTVPIVFVMVSDPIGMGYVESFARPGRNVTGFTPFEPSLGGKWLSLLKEIAPNVVSVGLAFNPEPGNNSQSFAAEIESAARILGVTSIIKPMRESHEIEEMILTLGRAPNSGLIFLPDAHTSAHLERMVALVARARVPAIYFLRRFSIAGGLMSYGIDSDQLYRHSAIYADRILRGAKPSELPVQAPTKFELIVNVKTARALDLTVPDKLLVAADEVIE